MAANWVRSLAMAYDAPDPPDDQSQPVFSEVPVIWSPVGTVLSPPATRIRFAPEVSVTSNA